MPTTPSGLSDAAILNGYVSNARDTASQLLTGVADAGVTVVVYDGATQLGTATADSGGAWSFTLGRLLDGTHRLTAVAIDGGGHLSAASDPLTFKVDTRPPSKPGGLADASISQGLVNATHNTAEQALTGKTDAGAHVAIYDGTSQIGSVTAGATGAWSFTLGQLAEGAHKLSATATDFAGNTSAASDLLSFTVDTHAPAAPVALDDAKIINGFVNAGHDLANQAVRGEAEAYALVTVYDGATKLGVVQASGDGFWSYTLGHLADGDHSLTATATDKAGNAGPASTALTFTVDTHLPPISIEHIGQFQGAPPGVMDIAGDSEPGAVITLSEAGTTLATAQVFDEGNWDLGAPTVANGQHSFTVTATDPAGNRTTTSLLYTQGSATEDGAKVKLNGLASAADSIVNLPASLPDGVTYDPVTHSFTLDPHAATYEQLKPGETTTVTVEYDVVHGATTAPAAVTWIVSGLTTLFLNGAQVLADHAIAPSDTVNFEEDLGPPTLVGDVRSLTGDAHGGDDAMTLGILSPSTAIGDALSITDRAHGGNDLIEVVAVPTATAIGDALTLGGDGVGGEDTVTAAGSNTSIAIGDANALTGHAHGGDDLVDASPRDHGGDTFAFGDGETMSDYAIGGDDTVSAGIAYGDAQTLSGHAQGGDDVVNGAFDLGNLGATVVYGDGAELSGQAQGGDDTVTGAVAYGDAQSLSDDARGGNDLVQGNPSFPPPSGVNLLYGDGEELLDHAQGGDDTLVGGASGNIMWGDAATVAPTATTGADLFVFAPAARHDQIMDFEPGKDRIEVDGYGFSGFADLSSHFQTTADGVLISFDADNNVLVHGVTIAQLSAGDFVFG